PVPVVIKRLDSEAVSRAEEPAMLMVPDSQGEHAAKELDAIRPVLLEGVQDGFSVAARSVVVSGVFKRRPDVGVIEDLAVIGDPELAGLAGHGLMAGGDIDDAEPPVRKVRPIVVIKAGIVGAAVADCIGHAACDGLAAGRRCGGDETRDPTHDYQS